MELFLLCILLLFCISLEILIRTSYKGLSLKTGEEKEDLHVILRELGSQLIYVRNEIDNKPKRVSNEPYIAYDNDASSVTPKKYTYLKDMYTYRLLNN